MRNHLITHVENSQVKTSMPEFKSGDTINISVRITEGAKSRIQKFEGLVIARKGSGLRENIIVRKFSNGIGVERTFPIHSPLVEEIKVVRFGKVRRNKLYYIRERTGKAARVKELIKSKK